MGVPSKYIQSHVITVLLPPLFLPNLKPTECDSNLNEKYNNIRYTFEIGTFSCAEAGTLLSASYLLL